MRNRIAILIVIIMALSLTGCWNRRDPENLAHVHATGLDYDPGTGMYHLTVQMANPVAMGDQDAGQGGRGEKKPYWAVSASGRFPFETMRSLAEYTSRELFWAHNKVLLLSERLARHGVYEAIDVRERERQLRPASQVAIVDGDIRKLMEADFPLEETGAEGIARQITTTRYERSLFPARTLNELLSVLAQPGVDMFIGRIEVAEAAEMAGGQTGSDSGTTNIQPPARVAGGALFKGDRMVGWADERQTIGWNYATGRSFRSTVLITDPVDDKTEVGVEITQLDSRMRPVFVDGDLGIEVVIRAEGRIQNFPGYGELVTESPYIKSLEQRTAEYIRNTVESTITLSRELESDIIGFGNLIYRKQPKLWKEIEDRWYEVFKDIQIDIKVDVNIRHSGLTASPMAPEKRR